MASSSLLLHLPPPPSWVQIRTRNPEQLRTAVITMRDRAKNRQPTQRGRYLSVEAIQAVQSLKLSKINGGDPTGRVIGSRIRRLLKRDMVAVLRELLSQGEGMLALQVFEEVRKEDWYKPQLSIYTDMITVLARNKLIDKVEQICSYLKMERLEPDTEGYNLLSSTLLEFGFNHTAKDCFRLMKLWECEPEESTYRILINGLESNGEVDLSTPVRHEAEKYFGGQLGFLEENDEMVLS